MSVLLAAVLVWLGALAGARDADFACRNPEWVAKHMNETVGWSLEHGRAVAKSQCRKGVRP